EYHGRRDRDDSPAREDLTSMALRRVMKIYEGIENLKPPLERPVVTLGDFDGVHRGHQSILAATLERAEASARPALLVTFRPHPLKVLRPDSAPGLLTPHEEKMRR